MAFIAGGANTGGVQSREQGVLKCGEYITPAIINDTTVKYLNFTVPAGKIWVLKSIGISIGDFVGTQEYSTFYIYDGSTQVQLQSNAGTSSFTASLLLPQQITLPAGFSIRVRAKASAYTSGSPRFTYSYQEIDA
jgi:hypothetical protein